MADRFFIAPYDKESGLRSDVKPWLIPDQAFERLQNAYVFRGRIKKRFGSRWLGETQQSTRLRVNIGMTDGAGNFPTTLVPGVKFQVGQMFSVGNTIFTVVLLGNAAMLTTGPGTGNFNTGTGMITLTGVSLTTAVYYYPATPVMGLISEETLTLNDEPVIAFDTQFAYQYVGSGWERLANGAATWAGSDSQFFWGVSWVGFLPSDKAVFVTNFNQNEPMRYLLAGVWNNFTPQLTAAPNIVTFLKSALILIIFKGYMLAMNTWEGDNVFPGTNTNFPFRLRYSGYGTPLNPDQWRQDIPGLGNFLDAPTTEAIITAEFVKDRLIVYFERSTWEIAFTSNNAQPFVWQKVNTELGAESTFSIVPFDKIALGVGNVGIHACNGINVDRVDASIPDQVFSINFDNQGDERVYGIRDYKTETVYWTFPTNDQPSTYPYPNQILVYNYKTGTWAINDDSITVFGYFQPQTGITWDSTTVTWDDTVSWDSGTLEGGFRDVVAGNQEGWTFIIDPEVPTNAAVLQITNLTYALNVVTITAINHNLRQYSYVYLQGITSSGNLNVMNNMIFAINSVPLVGADHDPNTFTFIYDGATVLAGTYTGGGSISSVSKISIKTKEYNFYAKDGRNAYVSKVDFLMTNTGVGLVPMTGGQIQVDYFVSTSITSMLDASDADATKALLGTGTLDTFPYTNLYEYERNAVRLWHPVYFQGDGEVVQLLLEMNVAQMRNVIIRGCTFEMHAMVITAQPSSSRLG